MIFSRQNYSSIENKSSKQLFLHRKMRTRKVLIEMNCDDFPSRTWTLGLEMPICDLTS